jgi:hypothetical protein
MYPRTAGNLKPVNRVLINEMMRAAESLGESGYRLAKCGILETTANAVQLARSSKKGAATRNNLLSILLSGGPKRGMAPEDFLGNFRID